MLFTAPVLFEVPVLPRVRKFLGVLLAGEPLVATPDLSAPHSVVKTIRLHLWAMAQSEKVRTYYSERRTLPGPHGHPMRGKVMVPPELTAYQVVGVAEFHSTRRYELFNHAELLVLSELSDLLIRLDYVGWMQDGTGPLRERTRRWVDQYDFSDEDIREEALRQYWLRSRKRKEIPPGQTPFVRVQHNTEDTSDRAKQA